MHMRYRTIHMNLPHGLPAALHRAKIQGNGIHEGVCVLAPGESPPIPLASVATAVFARRDILKQLDVQLLFNVLSAMPYLQELTVEFDDVEPAFPRPLPALPFHLRRLALDILFPDAFYIIQSSRDKLEYLALGPPGDVRRSTANMLGDLSDLPNLRALRIDTAPDRLALHALRNLTELAIRGNVSSVVGVCPQLTRLTIICTHFDDDRAQVLVEALPSFISLRVLEIEIDVGNDFTLGRGPGKQALASLLDRRAFAGLPQAGCVQPAIAVCY